PMSMFEATVEANNLAALASAKELYVTEMKEVCGGKKSYVNPRILEEKHAMIRERALACFNNQPKMGGSEHSEPFIEQLKAQCEIIFDEFKAQNKAKDIFSIFGPSIIFFCWLLFCLIAARFFDLIGITMLANMFMLFSTASICLISFYLYCKQQGAYPDFVIALDEVAAVMKKNVSL